MELECPYCKNELMEGFIYAGKYWFQWYTEDMSFLKKNTAFGGETLSETNKVKCFRCKNCNKIIIDINEL